MIDEIDRDRRRFLGRAVLMMTGAAQLARMPAAAAQSTGTRTAPRPAATTSFGTLKQIDAGVLNIGYAEVAPGRLAGRPRLGATQYAADGASDARNAAACRVKES
jgi:hypothetical protein